MKSPIPFPPDISDAPELAIFATLETVLELTINTIAAFNRELFDECGLDYQQNIPATTWVADSIATQAAALQQTLKRYNQALLEDRRKTLNQLAKHKVAF